MCTLNGSFSGLCQTKKSTGMKNRVPQTSTPCLQVLANGDEVPYEATLRNVIHDGARQPKLPPRQTQKHPVSNRGWVRASGCTDQRGGHGHVGARTRHTPQPWHVMCMGNLTETGITLPWIL